MIRRSVIVHSINLVILFFILCSSGCARAPVRFVDKVSFREKSSTADRIPLRVGLRLKPEFTGNEFYALTRPVKLGEGMRIGAEGALRLAFREVVVIDTRNGGSSGDAYDLIATPGINQRGIAIVGGAVPFLRCFVETKWTIEDRTGRTLYVHTFFGQSDISDRFFHVDEDMGTCMAGAVNQQYEEFVKDVTRTDWWRGAQER